MNRRNVVRLAMAAALFGAAIPGAAMAQVINAQAKYWTPRAEVQVQVQSQRSQDRFQDRYQDRFHRDMFEGRWVAQDRNDTNFRDGRGNGGFGGGFGRGRMFALPNFLSIDQGRRTISVMDGRNNLLQLIAIDNGFHGTQDGATVLHGDLNGNRLVAEGGSRGQQIHQVMILRDRGNTLVIRTQVQHGNWGRTVQVEKVYQRA